MISQFDDSIRFDPFPFPLIEGRTEDNNPTRRHLLKGSSTASNPKKDDQSRRQLFYGQECYCYYDNGILEDFDWEPPAGPPMGYPPMESPLLVEGISPMESPQYIESFQNVKPIINEEIFFGINNELGYGPGYLDFDDIETEFNGTGKITFATPEIIFLGPEQTFHCYEYLPKYEVSIPGVVTLSDNLCELEQDKQDAFILAIQETIINELRGEGQVFFVDNEDAGIEPGLEVVIGRFCNQALENLPDAPAADPARKLQQASSNWQVEYEVVVSNILCGSSGCSSFDDINDINTLITSVSDTLRTNIQNGDFVSQLIQNPTLQATVSSDILGCLVAWGSVYAATWGGINTNNAVQVTQTQGTVNQTINQLKFYPDWTGGSGTCLNDGEEPLYMQKAPSTWLYDSLEECCARYYPGWNEPECLHLTGTGLWYVDYAELKCVTDCEEGVGGSTCGGLAPPNLEDLYANPRECCKAHLQWVYEEFCEADSLGNECYVGTGKFYRGKEADEVCVRDCADSSDPTCGGVVDAAWVRLHDDASDCCNEEFSWIDNGLCAARSEGNAVEQYWPDQMNGKCVKDSVEQAKDLSVPLFDTAEACCKERMSWVLLEKCVVEADGGTFSPQGTGKYYVKGNECVKDCEAGSGTDCGGLAEPGWEEDSLVDTKSACCSTNLSWQTPSECLG
jgi:hypothetical protein